MLLLSTFVGMEDTGDTFVGTWNFFGCSVGGNVECGVGISVMLGSIGD